MNCRRKMEWRYLKELVPLERSASLTFGSVIHDCLEMWHRHGNLDHVLKHLEGCFPNRDTDEKEKASWHLGTAMMRGYVSRYPKEDFDVVSLEQKFQGPITNPKTGRSSRSFEFAGKMDGIVKIGKDHFLLEHKTAASLDASYLEKLWTDLQIIIYSIYAEKVWGITIKGVIYNVLVKARIQQRQGETEQEFERRREGLIAKSKTGKTTAKRRLPETDEEFQERLFQKYEEPEMFHRETLYITREQFRLVREELREMALSLGVARRTGVFLPNRSNCFQFNRPCAYLPLCRSGGNQNLIDNLYRSEPPHQELLEEVAPEPIF